jgi:hypothetical protein
MPLGIWSNVLGSARRSSAGPNGIRNRAPSRRGTGWLVWAWPRPFIRLIGTGPPPRFAFRPTEPLRFHPPLRTWAPELGLSWPSSAPTAWDYPSRRLGQNSATRLFRLLLPPAGQHRLERDTRHPESCRVRQKEADSARHQGQEIALFRDENRRSLLPKWRNCRRRKKRRLRRSLSGIGRGSVEAVEMAAAGEEEEKYAFHSFGAQFCELKVIRVRSPPLIGRFL